MSHVTGCLLFSEPHSRKTERFSRCQPPKDLQLVSALLEAGHGPCGPGTNSRGYAQDPALNLRRPRQQWWEGLIILGPAPQATV